MQRKIFLVATGLLAFSLVLSPLLAGSVQAATVTFDADTTLTLPNGIGLTILSGSLIESLVVNDDSSLTLTFGSDTNLTIRSNDIYTFSSVGGAKTCYAGSYSQVKYTETSGGTTLNVEPTVACTSGASQSSGGGGGGGTPPAAPTATSVLISSGTSQTESVNVTLTLAATNATTMLISNKADFSDATTWLTYAASKSWTLTAGLGTKTVYVKFRSSAGGESAAVSDSIGLVEAIQPSDGEDSTGSSVGSGSLIKKAGSPSLYYIGADGRRYAFPRADIYDTWYADFSTVQTVSEEVFNSYRYGGSVMPKPGTKLIQFVDGETPWNILNPKVYAVGNNGELRHITSASVAATLFGSNWETKIIPVIELLAFEYTFGTDIVTASDFNVETEIGSAPTINVNQGL